MSCSDIPAWYLRRRVAVVDLRSETWRLARREVVPPGYKPNECMRRLVRAGRLRRLGRGLYAVVDPGREISPLALASALYADLPHYVTTDAALSLHGLIDQPITVITVVLTQRRRAISIGSAQVRPVLVGPERFQAADAYATTSDGFSVRLASREQAVVDALAEPSWMRYGDLLPEVLSAFSDDELERAAAAALARSAAAAQRLGYLLEEIGRPPPKPLAAFRPVRSVRLRPTSPSRGPYSTRWRTYG